MWVATSENTEFPCMYTALNPDTAKHNNVTVIIKFCYYCNKFAQKIIGTEHICGMHKTNLHIRWLKTVSMLTSNALIRRIGTTMVYHVLAIL